MKTKTFLLATAALSIILASCGGKKDVPSFIPPSDATEHFIETPTLTTWHYFSLAKGEEVGSAVESPENNAKWAARTDWDFAVKCFQLRTNSGEATSVGAMGGVYTFDTDRRDKGGNIDVKTTFADVLQVPKEAEFAVDKAITEPGMGGMQTLVRSEAEVWPMKRDENGKRIMPPVWCQAPLYIFRSADGKNFYKVWITQFVNDENQIGHVKFIVSQIYR